MAPDIGSLRYLSTSKRDKVKDSQLSVSRWLHVESRSSIINCAWSRPRCGNGLSHFFANAHCQCGSPYWHLSLDERFAWLATSSALITLSVAALLEILAYYVPAVDNVLDTLATPASLVAGTVISAAVMTDLPPMVKWTAAVIAGGGVAGLTQAGTAMLRAKSTILTGGVGNVVISTAELGGALLISLLALAAPLAALGLVIFFLWLAMRLIRQLIRREDRSS